MTLRKWVALASVAAVCLWVGRSSYRLQHFFQKVVQSPIAQEDRKPSYVGGFSNVTGRNEVPCAADLRIVVFGQSNAANRLRPLAQPGEIRIFKSERDVANFNVFDGKCYHAQDPMLSNADGGATPLPLLGDLLVARGLAKRVLIAPYAIGGSLVGEWAPGGRVHDRVDVMLDALLKADLKPNVILWHQGEHDALAGTTEQQYIERFTAFVNSIRAKHIGATIIVAQASICRNEGSEHVREAQRKLPTMLPNVSTGPNTDQLTSVFDRFDGCHFSTRGAAKIAKMWADSIAAAHGL